MSPMSSLHISSLWKWRASWVSGVGLVTLVCHLLLQLQLTKDRLHFHSIKRLLISMWSLFFSSAPSLWSLLALTWWRQDPERHVVASCTCCLLRARPWLSLSGIQYETHVRLRTYQGSSHTLLGMITKIGEGQTCQIPDTCTLRSAAVASCTVRTRNLLALYPDQIFGQEKRSVPCRWPHDQGECWLVPSMQNLATWKPGIDLLRHHSKNWFSCTPQSASCSPSRRFHHEISLASPPLNWPISGISLVQ